MAEAHEFELLIRGGTVIDGSGAPRRRLDVGIAAGRVAALAPTLGTVVCSDCIFRSDAHVPLAKTLAALLHAAGAAAPDVLLSFQRRDDVDLLFFTHVLPYFGLGATRLEIAHHLDSLRWQGVSNQNIRDHIFLYSIAPQPK